MEDDERYEKALPSLDLRSVGYQKLAVVPFESFKIILDSLGTTPIGLTVTIRSVDKVY